MKYVNTHIYILFFIIIITQNYGQNEFPVLEGPYIGQKTPGLIPEIFAPDIVSINGRFEREGKSERIEFNVATNGYKYEAIHV